MKKAATKTRTFEFASEADIRRGNCGIHIKLTTWMSSQLRSAMPRGLAWQQPVEKGSVYWNIPVLQTYFAHGSSSEEYLKILNEYRLTLPVVS